MLKEGYAVWQCANHEISLTRPRIMGVLNVTPDSFSDGGEHLATDAAVARALEMLDEGAEILELFGLDAFAQFLAEGPGLHQQLRQEQQEADGDD
ncbi:MAG TPA: dihydropteroate synthase, partial [Atopobiaceae bacterium]|nr:dihydropteroate synthase [Atopobiaceae bacterium]